MTTIDEGQSFTVIVDYAHTPDSFEKLFKDLKPVVRGKMIVLFGSLGGGDKGKRPLQGKLAGEYADEVVVCEEDDRLEDPAQIMEDIAKGVEKAGKTRDKNLFLSMTVWRRSALRLVGLSLMTQFCSWVRGTKKQLNGLTANTPGTNLR